MNWTTVLFTPANHIERVVKAWRTAAADIVVADLEDGVPIEDKDSARAALREHLAMETDCLKAVRINTGERGAADLAALDADLYVVPKVECPEDVDAAAKKGPVLAIIESAKGVVNVKEICQHEAVVAIAFGAEDLAADTGMRRTSSNWEVSVPRAMLAIHAASEGIAAIDMITADFRDIDRTSFEAKEAKQLGYHGKMCLHPLQVDAVRNAFLPTRAEQEWAAQVLEAAKDVAGGGVVVVDGKMIDSPLILQAKRIASYKS